METVFFILAKTVAVMLELCYFAMLVRMLLPFFTDVEESRIYALTVCVTEPLIMPVRFIMYKLNIGQNSPVDWSFFVTSILVVLLMNFLPII